MVFKRPGGEGGSDLPKKRRHFASTLLKGFNNGRTVQESMSCLEPMLRKMVQEEVEQALNRYMRPSYNHVESPASRILQLQFQGNLPETLFTGNMLLSKDRSPIKVVLCDSPSKQIATSGPLSSLKLSIVVLDGDFGPDDREDWPPEEFDNKLVKTREGRRPLVAGETTVTLKDGVGYIGDLYFTDNSKWSRSGKFRLGAIPQLGFGDVSIREAVSNAFRVKDHRGEAYQKHYPPALDDAVWRLEKIAKDGPYHKKLKYCGIETVGDFLRLCNRDQSRLRGIHKVSSRKWDTIKGHAATCVLGEEQYMYRTTRGMLFFNSVQKLVGMSFDGVNYHPANTLNSFHMLRLVEELKQQAYNNLADWIQVSDPSIAGLPMLLGNAEADLGLPGLSFQEQDQHGMEMNGVRSVMPLSYGSEVGQENCSYDLAGSSHSFNPTFRNSFAISDPLTEFSIESWGSEGNYMQQGCQLSTDDLPIMGNPFQAESSSAWQQGNHGNGSPKAKWCKVRAVVKWRILARRNVAARKCKRLRFCSYV